MTYRNPFRNSRDLADWITEGPACITDDGDSVVLSSSGDPESGHWTLWCPRVFGDRIRIGWEFRPVSEPGLAMIFFAATGTGGRDLFAPELQRRDGSYPQYHSGDIATLHLSYLRHRWPDERAFRTCNLRKSPGFRMVAQAADPLPSAQDANDFYRMELVKDGAAVQFAINELPVLSWTDPEQPWGAGRIGLRQMAPLVAKYRNFRVETL